MLLKINQILKYILIGIITALSIKYVPTTTLLQCDIFIVAFIVSICYALMDHTLPSISLKCVKSEDN